MSVNVSIVIPTFNRDRLLRQTLDSLGRLYIPAGMGVELLVIDNNCTDETAAMVERAENVLPFPAKRILERRQGLCYGRNRGLEEASHEDIVYLDDDIEISPGWLQGYAQAVEQHTADCVVGPVTPRFEVPVPEYFTQRVMESISSSYSRKGATLRLLPPDIAHQVPGCNFGVRRSVAREVGGFNNALDRVGKGLLAGGDFEFGIRLVAAGKRIVYQPQCSIEHLIDAEKLSEAYMRKRWSGLGATARALQQNSANVTWYRRCRYLLGTARLGVASVCHRLRGQRGLAFQRELEARRSWAFLQYSTAQRSREDAALASSE